MVNKQKVIITGAAGQDGLILSKILLKKKFKVYGIIKKKKYKNLNKKVNYFQVDKLQAVKMNISLLLFFHYFHLTCLLYSLIHIIVLCLLF